MGKFVLKRLLALIPTILIIVFVVYFILDLTPSDPGHLILGQMASEEAVAAKNAELGYDKPFTVRYAKYIWDLCHGSLGNSWLSGKGVFETVMARFPVTVTLAAGATLIGVVIGVALGVLAAVKQYTFWDAMGTTLAMMLASFPAFWIGMMLILLFSLKLGWLPSYGTGTFKHFILPWFTTACSFIASQLRMTRTSLLECIRMDYVHLPPCAAQRADAGRHHGRHELRRPARRYRDHGGRFHPQRRRHADPDLYPQQGYTRRYRRNSYPGGLLYAGHAGGRYPVRLHRPADQGPLSEALMKEGKAI